MNDEHKHGAPDVPYFVYECELARAERVTRNLLLMDLIAMLALVLTNTGWWKGDRNDG